ncbi:hypothetical protein K7G98_37915, partial [Saccharothrix sp. MB29]|nr:hypothetical protein [Saccharothrix sp. MB29]
MEAVIKSGGRFPVFPEAYDQRSVEIELRGIDDEREANRCVPDTGSVAETWLPSRLVRDAETAAMSAADPWKVGTEHPRV